jgi:hypothetical protein
MPETVRFAISQQGSVNSLYDRVMMLRRIYLETGEGVET